MLFLLNYFFFKVIAVFFIWNRVFLINYVFFALGLWWVAVVLWYRVGILGLTSILHFLI